MNDISELSLSISKPITAILSKIYNSDNGTTVNSLKKQQALLLQRDRTTLLLVQILLTHDGGIYRA